MIDDDRRRGRRLANLEEDHVRGGDGEDVLLRSEGRVDGQGRLEGRDCSPCEEVEEANAAIHGD